MTWAVAIEGVGKRYTLGEREQYESLRDVVARGIGRVVGRVPPPAPTETIWALRDVSAEIQPGEIVGLVGRNGAGKSTLLKIVSRVTEPTEGRVRIRGEVGSLLEVGAGFHPELTGRENIYLSGSILGMRRRDITAKLDEIIEFSELARFMSTPVKRYSVGMYMRLAFTVAAHLDAEVLAVDEVLAVGDQRFRQKCLGKMSDVAQAGRTVLFVSHDLDVTTRLCDRCLLLDGGRVLADGTPREVTEQYLSLTGVVARVDERVDLRGLERSGTGAARMVAAEVHAADGSGIDLTLEIECPDALDVPALGVTIAAENGVLLVSTDSTQTGLGGLRLPAGRSSVRIAVGPTPLAPGRYAVGLWLADPVTTRVGSGAFDRLAPAFVVAVDDPLPPGARPDSLLAAGMRVERPEPVR